MKSENPLELAVMFAYLVVPKIFRVATKAVILCVCAPDAGLINNQEVLSAKVQLFALDSTENVPVLP